MLKRGWLGDKADQGFYKKVRGADGKEERLVLDPATIDTGPRRSPRCRAGDGEERRHHRRAAAYAARRRSRQRDGPRISVADAGHAVELLRRSHRRSRRRRAFDRRRHAAGFNWEMGPFEMWDAAGVASTVERMKALGLAGQRRMSKPLLAARPHLVVRRRRPRLLQPGHQRAWSRSRSIPGQARVADFRREGKVSAVELRRSLVDLGDGIGCIELHSLKNAIGGDVLNFISSILDPASDAVSDFAGFVISGDRENFSVGANLMQLLLAAQEGEWDEVAAMIRPFQKMTASIKFCPRPVVAAPFGLTLGGGAEICLHAARRQPHAETYMGLVEAGVGLIPAGGGTKEMLFRAIDAATALAPPDPRKIRPRASRNPPSWPRRSSAAGDSSPWPRFPPRPPRRAPWACSRPPTASRMNRDRLLLDAKAQAAALAESGYTPPQPAHGVPAPGAGRAGHHGDRHLPHGRSRLRQ